MDNEKYPRRERPGQSNRRGSQQAGRCGRAKGMMGERSFGELWQSKRLCWDEIDIPLACIGQENRRLALGDHPAGASPVFGIHPAIDTRDMLPSDCRHFLDADFGYDGFGWVQVLRAHIAIFAIIAILGQAIFANYAI
ncbi:hypothetical protein [Rhizobium sp. SGZ-381]|uniref:hypothetical protein n=1 Tax=Rhizobium sp. SGZ-381 TaxID=3342800 RepID=UPI00366B0CB9